MKLITTTFILLIMLTMLPKKSTGFVPNRVVLSNYTELDMFLVHMGQRESNNTYTVVNRYGMMGRYQFSPSTVRILGFDVDKDTFLSNPRLQDSVMIVYMRANHRELMAIIRQYEGQRFKGVTITRSGVLAAAHLVGAGNVKKYFADPTDMNGKTDANGTSLRHYLEEFNHYRLQETF